MADERDLQRELQILRYLNGLPQKILSLEHQENVPELLLYDLCDKDCFNIKKAAYLVDNPDFDFMKGVAGMHNDGFFEKISSPWQDTVKFSKFMKANDFNRMVRELSRNSMKKDAMADEKIVETIASQFDFQHPSYISWDMKNYNHGILIFEKDDEHKKVADHLFKALHLLSFCPIF
ncbi:MAG: hypothetical protein UR26_C0004G0013 [candidate division TM6 bacterium GW2011_GWF2_32_72]|nr:MAG: hypothetical protein UR26_C0004G0013 [candidate division TM6 bacterium GW2011_GWF2_32_72]